MSRLIFYLSWPLLWFYAPLTRRVRVVIIKDGRVLLVKNRFGPGAFQFPGGGIKFKESVLSAGAREIQEALSVKISNTRKLQENFALSKK